MNILPFRPLGPLLLLALVALCWPGGTAMGEPGALETDHLRVQPGADATAFEISVYAGGNTRPWRSLTSLRTDGPPLSRHLQLLTGPDGQPLQILESNEDFPGDDDFRDLTSADDTLRVRQRLAIGPEPYRLRLTIDVEHVDGAGELPAELLLRLGPGLNESPITGLGIATGLYSFVEGVVHQAGDTRRVRLDEPGESESVATGDWKEGSWAGLSSRYFALLVSVADGQAPGRVDFALPNGAANLRIEPRYLPQAQITLPLDGLPSDRTRHWEFEVFAGPKSRQALGSETAGDYSELLFHGLWRWMRALSYALLWLLEMLFALVPSWGLAICLLAVLVRVALYPFARWALASQQRFADVQRVIQPEIREIKQRYTGGEQSERILQLYEKHDISPLAGLKPLLIVLVQIPVFVALFHVLGQAYELREASFLWIDSLAEPDRLFGFGVELPFFGAWFNLLPVLMALTTLATIKLSPAPAATDAERRRQNIFLALMALAFFLLFYPFPAGMVLYWTMANLLHIAQAKLLPPGRSKPAPQPGNRDE